MNDVMIIGFFGLVIMLITIMTPIVRLNSSITKLNVTMENVVEDNKEAKLLIKEVVVTVNDLRCDVNKIDKRTFVLEEKQKIKEV